MFHREAVGIIPVDISVFIEISSLELQLKTHSFLLTPRSDIANHRDPGGEQKNISLREMTYCTAIRPFWFGWARKGTFSVEFLGLQDSGKIRMHASCGIHSLIVYLRERMKKASVAAKRRFCGVGWGLLKEGG